MLIVVLQPFAFAITCAWILFYRQTDNPLLKAHHDYITKTAVCGVYLVLLAGILEHSFNSEIFFIPAIAWCLYRNIKGTLLSLINTSPAPKHRA